MLTKILIVAVVTTVSMCALADGVDGGGGGAVVCRDPSGKIYSAELLDLYEGRSKYNISYFQSTGDPQQDYLKAVLNSYHLQGYSAEISDEEILLNITKFYQSAVFVKGGTLPPSNDFGSLPTVPCGCAVEQLAMFHNFDRSGQIAKEEIDLDIFNALDPMSKAALVTHETEYAWLKSHNEPTSENTRRAVAITYSDMGVPDATFGVPVGAQKHTISNKETPTVYYTYNDHEYSDVSNTCTIQFTHILGHPVLTRTTVQMPLNSIASDMVLRLTGLQFTSWYLRVEKFDGQNVEFGAYDRLRRVGGFNINAKNECPAGFFK
jgi:hypothetical protein